MAKRAKDPGQTNLFDDQPKNKEDPVPEMEQDSSSVVDCDKLMSMLEKMNKRAEEDLIELQGMIDELQEGWSEEEKMQINNPKEYDRLQKLKVNEKPKIEETMPEITESEIDVLKECRVEGLVVKLPDRDLDRDIYLLVKKRFELIGGAWKSGKIKGFVFQEDPTELLAQISTGTSRNLKKEFQYFGTSDVEADRSVELAKIDSPDLMVCEPSAGQGAIVKAILRKEPGLIVHCFELMDLNTTFLEKIKDVVILGGDFMEADSLHLFDRIIANPPFNKNQDIIHSRKMYNHLRKKGVMVSILGMGWMYGSTKKVKEFRAWLDDAGEYNDESWHKFCNIGTDMQFYRMNGDRVYIETIDAGAFKESGTNVRTCRIVIEKAN